MLHVALFAIVTVLLFAIVMGPALKPLVLAGMVMFSLMVFALVLTIELVPNDGPPPPISPQPAAVCPSKAPSVEL